MNAVWEALTEDLKTLRKGRGIRADRLNQRVGPTLLRACGVENNDDPATIREKITTTLRTSIAQLPPDLQGLMLAAFALDEETPLQFYQKRIDKAAERLRRDPRTVRRRIDDGIAYLVEVVFASIGGRVAALPDDPGPGWYTAELRTFVNLDLPAPEVIEVRKVVADRDDLDALDLAVTLRSPEHPTPDIDIFGGAQLVGRKRQTSDRLGYELALPTPLKRGDSHELVVRFRVEEGAMRPHYVCVPRYRCDVYGLHVRFGPECPAAVWRLSEMFQRDLDDPLPLGEPAEIDRTGEVQGEFRRLNPGLAYGFRWRLP